jgi:hypothetical protein
MMYAREKRRFMSDPAVFPLLAPLPADLARRANPAAETVSPENSVPCAITQVNLHPRHPPCGKKKPPPKPLLKNPA